MNSAMHSANGPLKSAEFRRASVRNLYTNERDSISWELK